MRLLSSFYLFLLLLIMIKVKSANINFNFSEVGSITFKKTNIYNSYIINSILVNNGT